MDALGQLWQTLSTSAPDAAGVSAPFRWAAAPAGSSSTSRWASRSGPLHVSLTASASGARGPTAVGSRSSGLSSDPAPTLQRSTSSWPSSPSSEARRSVPITDRLLDPSAAVGALLSAAQAHTGALATALVAAAVAARSSAAPASQPTPDPDPDRPPLLPLPFASVTSLPPPSSAAASLPTLPPSSSSYPSPAAAAAATAKAEVGRATWTLLHTLAAQFPARPTRQQQQDARTLVDCLTRIYPCGDCAAHFAELVRCDPPVVSSGPGFRRWLCQIHNRVNARLGKPAFNCDLVEGRWSPLGCSAEEAEAGEAGAGEAGCELRAVGAVGPRRR